MKLYLFAFLALSFLSGIAQTSTPPDLLPGYYVVVASFVRGEESYALAFAEKLNKEGQHSSVGFDAGRKFYHVYLDKYIPTSMNRFTKCLAPGIMDLLQPGSGL